MAHSASQKGYSPTDAQEREAVKLLEFVLSRGEHKRRVKAHVQQGDKTPNHDGFIELISGPNAIQVGMVMVQIKTLRAGALKFSKVDSELVHYSNRVSVPVILVCCDTSEEEPRLLWKHIRPGMPEFREGQKTVTVHFDPVADAIDDRMLYASRWLQLVEDYRKRQAEYDKIQQLVDGAVTLKTVLPTDLAYYQELVMKLNFLLAHDFRIVKAVCFPGVWQVGLGLIESPSEACQYVSFPIRYGYGAPLIVKLRQTSAQESMFPFPWKPDDHGWHGSRTRQDPSLEAREFVVSRLRDLVRRKRLRIGGELLCREVIYHFVDKYWYAMGLKAKDCYSVAELQHALFVVLPAWWNVAVERLLGLAGPQMREGVPVVFLELDALASRIPQDDPDIASRVRALLDSVPASTSLQMLPSHEMLRALEALEWLAGRGLTKIIRPYPAYPGHRFLWQGLTNSERKERAEIVLQGLISSYREFVEVNGLPFPDSVFLDTCTAFVCYYSAAFVGEQFPHPSITRYRIQNKPPKQPKFQMQIAEGTRKWSKTLTLGGNIYTVMMMGAVDPHILYGSTPLLESIYVLLHEDLERHYGAKSAVPSSGVL